MKRPIMHRECECCGKNIDIVMPGTRFCNSCSIYVRRLKNITLRERAKAKRLQERVYFLEKEIKDIGFKVSQSIKEKETKVH